MIAQSGRRNQKKDIPMAKTGNTPAAMSPVAVHSLDDVPRNRPLYIFGAGSGGRSLLRALRRAGGFQVAGVLDNNAAGGVLEGVPVTSPHVLSPDAASPDDGPGRPLVLLASAHYREMAALLAARGVSAVRNALPVLEAILRDDPDEPRRRALDAAKPDTMVIDIAASCNARCPFCPRGYMPAERAEGYMTEAVYQTALDEAERAGIRWLRLYSTGEPLLHPDFSAMVKTAKQRGFLVEASTNGHNLHRHQDALLMLDALQFSIDGWDRESFEYLRRPLRLDKVLGELAGFDALVKARGPAGFKRSIHLHVTRRTDIAAFIALWGDYTDEILISAAFPTPDVVEGRMALRVGEPALEQALFSLEPRAGFVDCAYPFSVITVGYDGRIVLCCTDFHAALDLGVIGDGIENILASETMQRARAQFHDQKFTFCGDCPTLSRIKPDDGFQQMRARALELAAGVDRPRIRVNL
jgi:hypothetical protein